MHEVAHMLAGALISQLYSASHMASLLAIVLAVVFDAEKAYGDLEEYFTEDSEDKCIHLPGYRDSCMNNKATFTHTVAYALTLLFITCSGICLSKVITRRDNWFTQNPRRGCLMILTSLLSHLVLDTFTYKAATRHDTHRYLYPAQFQFYLNTIFPDSDGLHIARIIIEWGIFQPFAWFMLWYSTRFPPALILLAAPPMYFNPMLLGPAGLMWLISERRVDLQPLGEHYWGGFFDASCNDQGLVEPNALMLLLKRCKPAFTAATVEEIVDTAAIETGGIESGSINREGFVRSVIDICTPNKVDGPTWWRTTLCGPCWGRAAVPHSAKYDVCLAEIAVHPAK